MPVHYKNERNKQKKFKTKLKKKNGVQVDITFKSTLLAEVDYCRYIYNNNFVVSSSFTCHVNRSMLVTFNNNAILFNINSILD